MSYVTFPTIGDNLLMKTPPPPPPPPPMVPPAPPPPTTASWEPLIPFGAVQEHNASFTPSDENSTTVN